MSTMIRLPVDPDEPDPAVLETAAAVIRQGGVVAIPTDTLYGLAVDPFNAAAVGRIFAVKRRSDEQLLPLVSSGLDQIADTLGSLGGVARTLAEHFWPGPLTLVVPASAQLAPRVGGAAGGVAVRVPALAALRRLCDIAAVPLTSTSANVSGSPPSDNPDDVALALGGEIDMLLDAGRTRGGPPSTIVDVTSSEPRLLRAGAISWEEVQRCLRRGA